jgi:hypothetical protein
MLTTLNIQNFKALRHLKIEKLAKVNLFVGEGNTGKTSVLEAIQCLPRKSEKSHANMKSWFRNLNAESQPVEWMRWLPHNQEMGEGIQVSATASDGLTLHAIICQKEACSLSGHSFVIEDSNGLAVSWNLPLGHEKLLKISHAATTSRNPSELAKAFDQWTPDIGYEDRFVAFVQGIEPTIKALRSKEHTGVRMLYASIGLPELIPLPLLGEGFNRLIEIFGAIIGEGAQIVLIDEIENGLHWKAHTKVWEGIRAVVATQDVQIFATTHSVECIDSAVEVFKGPPLDDLAVHRLERRGDGEIHCVTMDEQMLERMLERGWEVR